MGVAKPMEGQVFGAITVFKRTGTSKHGAAVWACQCKCGTLMEVEGAYLRSGKRSCGCVKNYIHSKVTHGKSHTSEWNIWSCMIKRCTNPKVGNFHRYGGRGIKVCDAWQKDFLKFLYHIGPRPSPLHTVDRINNDGNYEPGNVRWATMKEQSENKSVTRMYEHQGVKAPLAYWAEKSGMSITALFYRIKSGWSAEEIFTVPLGKRRKSK